MKSTENMTETLLSSTILQGLKNLRQESAEVTIQMAQLIYKKKQIEKKFNDLAESLARVMNKTKEEILDMYKDVPLESSIDFQMTIPEAMQTLLEKRGAMTQKEIIDALHSNAVRISEKSPYQVIGNTLRRDKGRRFKVLEDGRIDLAGNKKGNREIASKPKADVIRKRKGGV